MAIIDELYNTAKSQLAMDIAQDLQYDINNILTRIHSAKAEIRNATDSLKEQSKLHRAAKTLLKSMQKQQNFENVKSMQDVIEHFEEFIQSGKNKSKIFANTEEGRANFQKYINLQDASDSVLQQSQEQKAKQALLNGYQLIMGIREALGFKHINYGIIYTGINNSKQQQLLMGTANIESLIAKGRLNKSLSVVLEQSGAEIRNILNENIANPEDNNFINLLAQGTNAQTWNLLTQISNQLNKMTTSDGKRKYYYFYGQLAEALIDLENKDLTVDNIYEALIQGQNTVSFEKKGDFLLNQTIDGIEKSFEIQAKTFASYDTADNDIKTIRIISLSNIMRTLTDLENAFGGSKAEVVAALKDQFTDKEVQSKGQLNKTAEIEKEIKELIDKILKDNLSLT